MSVQEGYATRKQESDYANAHGMVFALAVPSGSLRRFDPESKHLDGLIQVAKTTMCM